VDPHRPDRDLGDSEGQRGRHPGADPRPGRGAVPAAGRAQEILTLDADDLDLPNKRARARSKGGAREWVFWQTGAALLLPRLLAGRGRGPVFLADRRPTRAVPANDLCPVTGRARLSYRRAEELFEQATARWPTPSTGRRAGRCTSCATPP
jgi:integrase